MVYPCIQEGGTIGKHDMVGNCRVDFASAWFGSGNWPNGLCLKFAVVAARNGINPTPPVILHTPGIEYLFGPEVRERDILAAGCYSDFPAPPCIDFSFHWLEMHDRVVLYVWVDDGVLPDGFNLYGACTFSFSLRIK
jgi:hypothetical protein